MGVFSDSVPREVYDDMRRQRDDALAARQVADDRYAALVEKAMEMKRHDLGMLPAGFEGAADPLAGAPKTALAIEEFAAGDAELRKRLVASAVHLLAVERTETEDMQEADAEVARLIRRGDQ